MHMIGIYAHIEKHLGESIELLFDLVQQPSVSEQGLGFDQAPQLVKRVLEGVGLTAETVPVPNNGHPSVFAWASALSPRPAKPRAGARAGGPVPEVLEGLGRQTSQPRTSGPLRASGTPALDSSKPTLLLYTFYDVQPPEPVELWESPPFEPTRRGDRVLGRGISDNKGNIAARLSAIRAFLEVRGGLPYSL